MFLVTISVVAVIPVARLDHVTEVEAHAENKFSLLVGSQHGQLIGHGGGIVKFLCHKAD